jgi:drug/metabolite transporter (DMT)-like permease
VGYGLVAAICWGFSALLATIVSRRVGAVRTAFVGHATGVVALTLFLVLSAERLTASGASLLALPFAGILVAVAFLAVYRGLALGPVALVAPISAGYAGVTVMLAVPILGERPSPLASAGIAAIVCGVVLSSTEAGKRRERRSSQPSGVPFGVISMCAFGVATLIIGYFSKRLGWFDSVYLTRLASGATLLAILGTTRRSPILGVGHWPLLLAGVIGILDAIALSAYGRGSELGHITIVAVVSATNPLVPLVGGITLLHERIDSNRMLGVALVGVGLLLVAAGG